jgi:predicted phage terminase large subunit-like protein
LWRRDYIKYELDPPEMERVVVAIDPAVSNEIGSDETGIIVVGKGVDGKAYVFADESGKFRPEEWARRAISAFNTYDGDCMVAEVNQGGDMVEAVIKTQAKNQVIRYKAVHATKGKAIRAEPIAALYEQNKVRHVGPFPELEDQMCSFTIGFDRKSQGYSPDRVDALVWALTELFPSMTKRVTMNEPVSIPKLQRLRR